MTLEEKRQKIRQHCESWPFPCERCPVSEVIEGRCYQALQRIKAIIQDDSLEDPACFQKIEEIVCALESIGSNGGGRHDFG